MLPTTAVRPPAGSPGALSRRCSLPVTGSTARKLPSSGTSTADGPVTVQVGDEIQVLAAKDGGVQHTVGLPAGTDRTAPAERTAAGALLVLARGTLYSLDPSTGAVRWQRPATGLPDTLPSAAAGPPAVLVPEDDGFVAVDPATGKERRRLSAPGLPAGGRTAVVGSTVVYRLPGTVLAYR